MTSPLATTHLAHASITPEESWRPLVLCQDFIGHRTHAALLDKYLSLDSTCASEVTRFSVANHRGIQLAAIKALGYRIPVPFVRSYGLDLWSTRSILVQSWLANQAWSSASPSPDVAYIHTHAAGRVARHLDSQVPVVVSIDGTFQADTRMEPHSPGMDRPAFSLERAIFDRAALIVAFSDWARDSVINDYGIHAGKTVTIRNGVEVPPSPASMDEWIPVNDLPIIGFVGNGLVRKGGDLLLDAHQRYLSHKSHLVMVTGDRIRSDGLRNVSIVKPMSRERLLGQMLPRFAVYAHPARSDWSPYTLIEALATGLPVVSSNVGAIPEMVESEVNGYLLSRRSPVELGEALSAILDDPSQAAHMGRQSKRIFQERYDAARNYPTLVQAIKCQRHSKKG